MKENLRGVSKLSLVIVGLISVGILGSGILISYYAPIIGRNLSHVTYAQSTDSIFGGSSTSSSSDNSKQDLVGNKKHSDKETNSNEEQTIKSSHSNRNIAPQARLSSYSSIAGYTSNDNNRTSTSEKTKHVSIVGIKKDKSFDPNPIEINAGDSVTWTNDDKEIHTVTSGNQDQSNTGQEFDSGTLASGQSFTHKFNKSGTYDYFCSFHDSMTGKVIVK